MSQANPKYIQQCIPFQRYERRAILREIDLPSYQKALLKELNEFSERDGKCFPSQGLLAECIGAKSSKTVRKHLQVLEDLGLIIRTQRSRAGNRGATSDEIIIVWEELAIRTNRTMTRRSLDQKESVADQAEIPSDQTVNKPDQEERHTHLEIEKEPTKETTTTPEWECVVFLLNKFKVGGWKQAIARAKARNATPKEVTRIIERIANNPNIEDHKKAGTMYHQVCDPPPEPEIKPRESKRKRPDREIIRQRVSLHVRGAKRSTDSEPVSFRDLEPEIERITNEIYARDLKAYEESRFRDSQPPQHSIELEAIR